MMMTLYWQPADSLDALRRQLDTTFDGAAAIATRNTGNDSKSEALWQPLFELIETPESFWLQASLAGVAEENILVEATQHSVVISGERPIPSLGSEDRLLYTQLAHGKFRRLVELPMDINPEKVQASFCNGLLSLVLPKADYYQSVKVQINGKKETEQVLEPVGGVA